MSLSTYSLKKNSSITAELIPRENVNSQSHKKRDFIICCKACQQIITKDEFSISVGGHHEHLQTNPYGVTFIFRCFNQAWNTNHIGNPESAHSWFPGFEWTMVTCGGCNTHLGWYFSNLQSEGFWGLISEKLVSHPQAS